MIPNVPNIAQPERFADFDLSREKLEYALKETLKKVDYMMELRGLKCKNIEGRDNSSWILVDYGTVIVHVLSREAREFYNLDKLYGASVAETETETEISEDNK